MAEATRTCVTCDVDISHRHGKAKRCEPCADVAQRESMRQRDKRHRARRAAGETLGRVREDLPEGHKRCSKCQEVKPVAGFSPRGGGRAGYQAWCKLCLGGYSTKKAAGKVRERRGLSLDTPSLRGSKPHKPEGYTYAHRGYVIEKRTGHHRADKYGWVFQHILVAEARYGFPITRAFTVHHVNADRADNRPENLELRLGNHGKGGDVVPTLLRDPAHRAEAVAVLRAYGYVVSEPAQAAA